VKDSIFKSRFSVTLLNGLADLATETHFTRENTDHANKYIDANLL